MKPATGNPLLERFNALGGWDEVADWYGQDTADLMMETALAWAAYPDCRRGAERAFQKILRELGIG